MVWIAQPYNALNFGIFELAVIRLRARFVVLSPNACDLVAGALAGALTALLTTPMDLVNTRMQTQAVDISALREGVNVASNFSGLFDAAVRIVREEGGPQALMRGAGLRTAMYAPSALVFFFVYGWIKRMTGH